MHHYTGRIGFLEIRNRSHAAAVRQRNDRDDERRRPSFCRVECRRGNNFERKPRSRFPWLETDTLTNQERNEPDNATRRDTEPERGTIRTSGARGVCASTANFTQRASSTISRLSILVAPTRRACPAPGRPSLSRFFISAYRYVFSSTLFSIQFRPACLGRLYPYHTRYSIFLFHYFAPSLLVLSLCPQIFHLSSLTPAHPQRFLVLVLLTINALVCFMLALPRWQEDASAVFRSYPVSRNTSPLSWSAVIRAFDCNTWRYCNLSNTDVKINLIFIRKERYKFIVCCPIDRFLSFKSYMKLNFSFDDAQC